VSATFARRRRERILPARAGVDRVIFHGQGLPEGRGTGTSSLRLEECIETAPIGKNTPQEMSSGRRHDAAG
ncbi:MAG: hypothetical protein ACRDZT_04020, partial [Acidimicrobiales bacterium]